MRFDVDATQLAGAAFDSNMHRGYTLLSRCVYMSRVSAFKPITEKMFIRVSVALGAWFATTCALAQPASTSSGQAFPEKPMRMIVPFSAGAGTDLLSRIIARKLGEAWGQNMIVENRPGGGTIIGVAAAAKAPPDGYTLVMVTPSFIINATGLKKLPYDSLRDFTPVTLFATSPLLLVAHPSLPVKSVKELIALAKMRPSQIMYASAGNGSPTHLGMEVFRSAGAVLSHVPYKGAAPGVIDLLGGHVQVMMTTLAFVKPHVESGKLRALGVSTAKRAAAMPQVPTIAETLPGYEVLNWWGVLAPAGTPAPIISRLNGAMVSLLRDADVQETFAREGLERAGSSAGEFGAYIRTEIAKWSKVAKETGVQLD
jgi:tripartite-type tricarboxylate transporter receptor subunit TctC